MPQSGIAFAPQNVRFSAAAFRAQTGKRDSTKPSVKQQALIRGAPCRKGIFTDLI